VTRLFNFSKRVDIIKDLLKYQLDNLEEADIDKREPIKTFIR